MSVHAGKYGQKTNQKQTLLKLSITQKSKQRKTEQNKTSLVQSLHTTLSEETRSLWAYSATRAAAGTRVPDGYPGNFSLPAATRVPEQKQILQMC